MKRKVSDACLILAAFAFAAPAQQLPKGQIVDKVESLRTAGQSFALYLPSSYDSASAWPILYCFDARARGRLAVERFRDAAEKYGYIVAGSNNSRNGPNEPITIAMQALWDDTQSRFNIDPKRMYSTGFSGGARVALHFAAVTRLAGVIPCGAAFAPPNFPKTVPFAVYGIAGTDDFNMPEFREADRRLDAIGTPHRIRQFDGGHDWPAAALCTEAVEWLELQAMKSGRHPRDEALISSLFEKGAARIGAAETSGNLYEAWIEAAAMASDFEGLRDVSAAAQQASRLRDSKPVKAALKREEQTDKRQTEVSTELARLDHGLTEIEERQQNLSKLRALLADLQRRKDAREDTPDRRAARRSLLWFHIMMRDEAGALLAKRDFAFAAARLEAGIAAEPERFSGYYDLAVAYAQSGQKGKAIAAVRTGIEKGARDIQRWTTDPLLAPLREDPEFRKLVSALE